VVPGPWTMDGARHSRTASSAGKLVLSLSSIRQNQELPSKTTPSQTLTEGELSVDPLKTLKVDKVVDTRQMPCPGPLLETKKAMNVVPMDGILEVISSDIAATLDIPAWAIKAGHQYLGMITDSESWKLYVRRRK